MDQIQFLESFLGQFLRQGKELLFQCPFCSHHKKKLSINTDIYSWKCWVCDSRGRSIFSLIWKLDNKDIFSKYNSCFFGENKNTEQEEVSFTMSLPQHYIPLCTAASVYTKKALSYLSKRNVTSDHILRYKIGIAVNGRYKDRIILPSFDAQGKLNFFTGRHFLGNSCRYLNPKTPRGYKDKIVLNELNIDWAKPVFLVEGFFDMLQLPNCIPLFGSALNENSKIFSSIVLNNSKVFLCLDSDAKFKQISIASSFLEYGIHSYQIDTSPFKDFAEMNIDQILSSLKDSKRSDRISLLRDRINHS